MDETFLNGRVTLHPGDCLDVLAGMAENSLDTCVTDPPYHLTSIVQRFGAENAAPVRSNLVRDPDTLQPIVGKQSTSQYGRLSTGFMGKVWDGGAVAFDPDIWRAVYRVLKPGAHLIAMGGTRTFHRLACAIEDAGFEIRDTISWLYGSGFPKSHAVSKGIDRAAGAEREVVGVHHRHGGGKHAPVSDSSPEAFNLCRLKPDAEIPLTAPATDAARQWEGWGTALKPAAEICVLAQKPFDNGYYIDTIGSTLLRLWGQLWSMLPAKDAALFSRLNPSGYGVDVSVFVQWNAENGCNIRAALCAQMVTSQFELELISSLSTVSSWVATWAESWTPENTSITEMELKTTTDLQTLSYLASKITLECIIRDHRHWSPANASSAASLFSAVVQRLRGILELSAVAPALSKVAGDCRGADVSPNLELIVLARKPLSEGTVAANVLRWGTGAINVDGCRVEASDHPGIHKSFSNKLHEGYQRPWRNGSAPEYKPTPTGRWPANVVHDGSDEVTAAFPESGPASSGGIAGWQKDGYVGGKYEPIERIGYDDNGGSAARFFYTAKADADDRLGSKHPTVKPLDLMQWLVRLVTPRGGTVLDPFAGTGTTGEAAWREGMHAVLIEAEPEYQADIRRRMALMLSGPDERSRESIKAKNLPRDDGPLFARRESWAEMWAKPFDFSQEPKA